MTGNHILRILKSTWRIYGVAGCASHLKWVTWCPKSDQSQLAGAQSRWPLWNLWCRLGQQRVSRFPRIMILTKTDRGCAICFLAVWTSLFNTTKDGGAGSSVGRKIIPLFDRLLVQGLVSCFVAIGGCNFLQIEDFQTLQVDIIIYSYNIYIIYTVINIITYYTVINNHILHVYIYIIYDGIWLPQMMEIME